MNALHLLTALLIAVAWAAPRPQEKSIESTKSQTNPEYVFIQSSGPGSRKISRKDKSAPERPFETSHKLPASLTFLLDQNEDDDEEKKTGPENEKPKTVVKRSAPAPAGAIRLDVKKLLEKYKDELATSTTTPKPSTKTTSRKSRARSNQKKTENKRVKKSAEVTTVSSVLTTSKIAPKVDDDDVSLLASGSEKQRSRIQIKKGPNGQEYEYEYVYYYYDEDEDAKEPKETKEKQPVIQEITNAHDGPARNEIVEKTLIPSRRRTTEAPKTTVAPEANEILPSSSRSRSRHVQHSEEAVSEERLPASTRFPPRSRNLNTTPQIEETSSENSVSTSRPRIRRPQKENVATDNVTDETQGSRGRTRANVKRPSLELIDSDTFNTNYNAATSQSDQQGGPSFPTDLPAGPVRFLGVTPNESVNLPPPPKDEAPDLPVEPVQSITDNENLVSEKTKDQTITEDSVSATDPMDKVALDLYAISQGNQKLLGEENQTDEDQDKETDGETTTEISTTTTTTATTTTTTTTTTTPAPTTTTTTTTTTQAPSTEDSLFGRGRYRGRLGNKKTTTTTTESSASESNNKPKKFGGNRSSFGGRRSGARTTTAAPEEEKISRENVKPVNNGRTSTRNRFGSGNRSRSRTTASPSEEPQDSNNVSPSTNAPRPSRPRPTFNIRGRTRPTPAPPVSEETSPGENDATSEATVSTTAKSRRIQPGSHSAVRPLRPGPRLNLSNRRIGNHHPTSSTEAPVQEDGETGEGETQKEEEKKEESSEPTQSVENNPINRLRNRNRIQVGTASKPKASASSPVQVRRVNPLIARRRPGQKSEPSTEAPAETQPTEASTDVEEEEPAETVAVSSTTEQPRGLSKLLAGRRRLAGNHRLPGGNQ